MAHEANENGVAQHDENRRRLLQAALIGAGSLAAGAAAGAATTAKLPNEEEKSKSWKMMFDLTVRFSAGKLDEWNHFWGDQNVALLEENGQWLWAAWTGLSGQQNTVTHQWAYRDLAHYQDMAKMRATNPRVREVGKQSVPIEENMLSSIMTPLPYHPALVPQSPKDQDSLIVTSRIFRNPSGNAANHARLTADYVALAAKHGAQLVGAFESFFGWTPSYMLQVWRYPSMERYWTARREIEADAEGKRLLAELRSIFPHETIELNRPLPYSRLR